MHLYRYTSRYRSIPFSFFAIWIVWGVVFTITSWAVTNYLHVGHFEPIMYLWLLALLGVYLLPQVVLWALLVPEEIELNDSYLTGKRKFWGEVHIPWKQVAKMSKERGSFGHEWVWLIANRPWLSGRYLLFSSQISDYGDLIRRIEDAKGGQ